MIPFFRSLNELMVITHSDYAYKNNSDNSKLSRKPNDNENKVKSIITENSKAINLPKLPNIKRKKWIKTRKAVSKLFDELDYNNQIQSSYEITLFESQNSYERRDIA